MSSQLRFHVEFTGFREHGDESGRRLDTALGLGLGNTLDAVHAGLILHHSVNAFAAELEDYLLVAAGRAGGLVGDLKPPAAGLCKMLIHTEQVAGKDGRLVASGTAADFHDGVLAVVGVGRNEEKLDLLLQGRHLRLQLGNLFTGHLAQLVVFLVQKYVLGRLKVVQQFLVLMPLGNNRFELLVIFV